VTHRVETTWGTTLGDQRLGPSLRNQICGPHMGDPPLVDVSWGPNSGARQLVGLPWLIPTRDQKVGHLLRDTTWGTPMSDHIGDHPGDPQWGIRMRETPEGKSLRDSSLGTPTLGTTPEGHKLGENPLGDAHVGHPGRQKSTSPLWDDNWGSPRGTPCAITLGKPL
jgi:hypothetical protein